MEIKALILFALMLTGISFGQELSIEWVKTFGGSMPDDVQAITTDDSGNVYITGSFQETVDFDPGLSVDYFSAVFLRDVFIQKYLSTGDLVWTKTFGNEGYESGLELDFDSSGNLVVIGYFRDTIDVDSVGGMPELIGTGTYDNVFILKMNPNGDFIWAKSIGGAFGLSGIYCEGLAIDSQDNIIIAGGYWDNGDFDPGIGQEILTGYNNGTGFGGDGFIVKLDSMGNYLWTHSIGGDNYDYFEAVDIDANGNIYATGEFSNTAYFLDGATIDSLVSNDNHNVLIQKLDPSGSVEWTKGIEGPFYTMGYDIVTDDLGNSHITGSYQGLVDFDPSAQAYNLETANPQSTEMFVLKLNNQGEFLWAGSTLGTSPNNSQNVYGNSICLDSQGNVYTTGVVSSFYPVDMNPGGNEDFITIGGSRSFIQVLNKYGNFIWAKVYGSYYSSGNAIECSEENNIYLAGWNSAAGYFDVISNTFYVEGFGFDDCIVAKYTNGIVGLKSNLKESRFLTYPNPTEEIVNFDLGKVYPQVQIVVRNPMSQLVYEGEYQNVQKMQFKITGQPGLYFVELISNSASIGMVKVVKQ